MTKMHHATPASTLDERLLVPHFSRRHHLHIDDARRALTELGPADAEALAAAKVLTSYLDGSRTLAELLPGRTSSTSSE